MPDVKADLGLIHGRIKTLSSKQDNLSNEVTSIKMRLDNIEEVIKEIKSSVDESMTELFGQLESCREMMDEILKEGENDSQDPISEEREELEVGHEEIEPLELPSFSEEELADIQQDARWEQEHDSVDGTEVEFIEDSDYAEFSGLTGGIANNEHPTN